MGHAPRLTYHSNHHVGLLRSLDGFVDHDLRRARVVDHFGCIKIEEVEVVDDALIVRDIGTTGVDQVVLLGDGIAHAVKYGHRLRRLTGCGPAAHNIDRGFGQRAHQGNARLLVEGQGIVLVFQQYQALACHFTGFGTMQAAVGLGVGRVIFGLADTQVRVGKQAHVVLGPQHLAYSIVQIALRHFTRLEQARQFFTVGLVVHAHVDTGLDRQLGGLAAVLGHAVFDQLVNRAVVADCHAFEAPVLAQQILHQPHV